MDAEFQVSLLAMSKLPGAMTFVSRLQAYRAIVHVQEEQ